MNNIGMSKLTIFHNAPNRKLQVAFFAAWRVLRGTLFYSLPTPSASATRLI